MMQKVQRWSQPCCTCRQARARDFGLVSLLTPTSASHAFGVGPSLSPLKGGEAMSDRIASLSAALRRQPKVMISTPSIGSAGEQHIIEAALEGERRRPGHDHMTVLAPMDVERPAVERDRGTAAGQAAAMAGDQRGT